jgi:AraC-like DNA-binding protein
MAKLHKRAQKYREQVYTHPQDHQPVLPPIRVITALVSRWGPGDRFGQINRPVVSFNLVTRGNLAYRQRGKDGVARAGELFIAQKGCDQMFETGDAGFLHKRTILVDGVGLDPLMQATGLSTLDRITFENGSHVTGLFRRCYRMMRDKPDGFARELSNLAYGIISECCLSRVTRHPTALRAAIQFLEQNIHETIPLARIAAAAGVSVRQCIRLFQVHAGCSPISFFIGLKMNSAKVLLSVSSLSIKQVGMQVGYTDPYYFSSQFKRRTGHSPRSYRRMAQAETFM